MGVVILSTVVFILSTMPELTDDIDMLPNTNTSEPVERWEDVSITFDLFLRVIFTIQGIIALEVLDHLTMIFFTLGRILIFLLY